MKKISLLITLLAISSSAEARWFWQNNDAENMSDNNCKNEGKKNHHHCKGNMHDKKCKDHKKCHKMRSNDKNDNKNCNKSKRCNKKEMTEKKDCHRSRHKKNDNDSRD